MSSLDRFLKYVSFDTQSDDTSSTVPSTMSQKKLGLYLVNELKDLGLKDAYMDEHGVVYAHLKGIGDKIGFNAHIDTALEMSGKDIHPRVIENYDGKDIILCKGIIMRTSDFNTLKDHVGQTLVVTDGHTLLGADDKAGIAIIMEALNYITHHKEIPHHNLSICFTVDEEIGEGATHFDMKKMDADYAYSFDGANPNEISIENFNAYGVTLKVKGFTVHPGSGKGKLINALFIINQIVKALPEDETPFDSENDQGYWHINSIEGTSEEATLKIILRDFNNKDSKRYFDIIKEAINKEQKKFPNAKFELDIICQYENMYNYAKDKPYIVERAKQAIINNGGTPILAKIRGGTDGASFSKMGLITPNLGTGSYNHHGRFEYLVKEEFEKLVNICIELMKTN